MMLDGKTAYEKVNLATLCNTKSRFRFSAEFVSDSTEIFLYADDLRTIFI